jgi:heptosyltransferase-2
MPPRGHPSQRPPENLLVVLPNWIGDVVLATPALRALHLGLPEARTTYLLRDYVRAIVEPCEWYDELLFWPLRMRLPWIRDLRRRRFDLAVLLTNSFRSALVCWLGGVHRRVGYDRDGRGWLLTDRLQPRRDGRKFVPESMLEYYRRLVEHVGCPYHGEHLEVWTRPADDEVVEEFCRRHRITPDRPIVVINPGAAFGSSKLWPTDRFAAVADRLIEDAQAQVIVPCAPSETALAAAIGQAMKHRAVVLSEPGKQLTLRQLIALIRRANLLLGNDTGPRHFAAAVGTPSVTVFGSTDPAWTETNYAGETKVMIPVDCGPCQLPKCPLDHRCMTGITVEMVADACLAKLRVRATARA